MPGRGRVKISAAKTILLCFVSIILLTYMVVVVRVSHHGHKIRKEAVAHHHAAAAATKAAIDRIQRQERDQSKHDDDDDKDTENAINAIQEEEEREAGSNLAKAQDEKERDRDELHDEGEENERISGRYEAVEAEETTTKTDLNNNNNDGNVVDGSHSFTLRAYLEPIDRSEEWWDARPLPVRQTQAERLEVREYPGVRSCSRLPEEFPIDNYPDEDPFLPWIHDVFPTHDGRYVQFVAQNKRRCHTGTTPAEKEILHHTEPQAALFQQLAVKRITDQNGETRYQLTDHDNADPDGMATRFICRFKPTMQETLSVYNINYEYTAWRKGQKGMFTKEGRDNKSIFTSQLLFQCPVPEDLQETIRTGTSVQPNDMATIFVDVIPMRTPVRYTSPNIFFPPWYKEFESKTSPLDASQEWGDNHILPRIEDSGRWENIPVCKPTLHTYKPVMGDPVPLAYNDDQERRLQPNQLHRLVACTWASTGYHTRGERFHVTDGHRRMREWIHFNLLVGVEHFYFYDNSGAHTNASSLQPIAEMFPEHVTIVRWPAKVCNNNPNNVDSCGERSSQYAAEASCRLRFGPYVDWIGGFDIDEYLVPMGQYNSLTPILDKLDREGMKMINFKSYRSWPRKTLIEEPIPIDDWQQCRHNGKCFELKVPPERTVLQTYNCEREKGPKKKQVPAEKQLYKADYVKMHFIHYSTVTALSMANKSVFEEMAGQKWVWPMSKDLFSRFSDELNEGTMLHTKAMARQDTSNWLKDCRVEYASQRRICRIGNPFPDGAFEQNITGDKDGWLYNCFVNTKIEEYFVPRLETAMKSTEEQYLELIKG